MVNSLDKKWKELLFAFSGFGPNLLMVLMGAYFTDAINPAALVGLSEYQTFATGACYILPAVFPILYAISKAFDGIIDIPFAHFTDTFQSKWGRRRPAIAMCFLPMVISYALCWMPLGGIDAPLFNTIWIVVWSLVFFASYTMCLIAFYGSLSTVCTSESQRLRVSSFKSFFDTISYCFVYALVPLLLGALKMHINEFVLYLGLPLMITMLIPLFLIKEGEKYGYPENYGEEPVKVTFKESLSLTFKNKIFSKWLVVNCCTYFGLQLFLVSMNTLIVGGMGMSSLEMAILNTCAFAPVPVMLYLFNKLKSKKGVRFTYQTCLIAFAIAIMSFFIGSTLVLGDNKTLKMIIGCIGGVMGSWAIGAFFMMPYLVTAQISSVEEKLTKKNHSAMYFAANAVVTSIVGAISGSLVYELIKNLFFSTEGGMVWAESEGTTSAIDVAAKELGASADSVFNLGTTLVPFIVATFCILGVILAFKMPRDYTPTAVAKELKKQYPELDVSNVESVIEKEEKGEIIFVQIGLSILSGFIFGYIWQGILLGNVRKITNKTIPTPLSYILASFIPFASIFVLIQNDRAISKAIGAKRSSVVLALLGIIFPILPINFIALSILQHKVNKFYRLEEKKENV